MRWKDKLIKDFEEIVDGSQKNEFKVYLHKIQCQEVNLHLAIFNEPFLNFVLTGIKTIESRLSINNVAPFRRVLPGDIVFVKKSSAGLCAIFEVGAVHYFTNLKQKTYEMVNSEFGKKLCWNSDPEFLNLKSQSKFLSLITIDNLKIFEEFKINKSDRTGWVVIRRGLQNTLFDEKNK
ncbi:hypothetical protein ACLI09_02665 [Flavobacterium sp. RHBU_24]|uniref:hypothetical protein n=1 Tax=Flavobacterium sp. RHBU_24 TaxID=3391185 RepID=UPI003984E2DA